MVNKKAISPLIATLLLIAFTVALGVMIMNFGKNLLNDYGGCDSIDIAIDEIQNSLCYKEESSEIAFTIINKGKTEVSSLTFQTINTQLTGQDRFKEFNLPNSKIAPGAYHVGTHPYIKPEGFVIKFIPKITFNNGEQICPDQAIEINSLTEDVPACP